MLGCSCVFITFQLQLFSEGTETKGLPLSTRIWAKRSGSILVQKRLNYLWHLEVSKFVDESLWYLFLFNLIRGNGKHDKSRHVLCLTLSRAICGTEGNRDRSVSSGERVCVCVCVGAYSYSCGDMHRFVTFSVFNPLFVPVSDKSVYFVTVFTILYITLFCLHFVQSLWKIK